MKKLKSALVLLCLAGVITAVTFTVSNTITHRAQRNLAIRTNQKIAPSPTPMPSPKPTIQPTAAPRSTLAPSPAATPAPTPVHMILPATGAEVAADYTGEVLVFQSTYGDYRAHIGIDFAKEKNAPVCAVADGIVRASYFDYETGYTVEVEHSQGLSSKYCNLSTDKMAQAGQVVRQGDVIGGMGDSGIFEAHLPYHVHFELYEDNEPINPKRYLEAALLSSQAEDSD